MRAQQNKFSLIKWSGQPRALVAGQRISDPGFERGFGLLGGDLRFCGDQGRRPGFETRDHIIDSMRLT